MIDDTNQAKSIDPELQYQVTPVPAHIHNGIDSPFAFGYSSLAYTTTQPTGAVTTGTEKLYYDGTNYFLYVYAGGTWRYLQMSNASATTIARDAASTGSSTGPTVTVSHTCSGTNRLLIVAVRIASASDQVTSVTYAGANMTQFSKQIGYAVGNSLYLYYILQPSTGANNIVVNESASPNTNVTGASYTGVSQTISFPDSSGTISTASAGATLAASAHPTHTKCWLVGAWTAANTDTAGASTAIYAGTGQNGILDSNGIVSTGTQTLTMNTTATEEAALSVIAVAAVTSV